MATTVRLDRPGADERSGRPIAVAGLARGAFGASVLDLMDADDDLDVGRHEDAEAAFAGPADVVVLVLWRPDPGLCERADALAHERGRPWFPVIAEHPVIRVGPVVRPGRGACFACYARRRVQHDAHGATTRHLYAAYASDPGFGPAGFLPHHARTAAGIAARLVAAVRDATVPAGTVVTTRLLRTWITADPVVSCHGCTRCRVPRPPHDLAPLLEPRVPEAVCDDAG